MTHKEFAVDLAYRAGKIMRENFGLNMRKEWKSDNSPVTATDLEINEMVVQAVTEQYPEHGILAEEGGSIHKDSAFVWVCDPLDGTVGFSHGIPTSVFSLALVEDGKPILGVVYEPFLDRLFTAEVGKGAYMNGRQMHVSTAESLERNVVSFEAGMYPEWKPGELYDALLDNRARLIKLASHIYESMLVACGELVGALYAGGHAHDTAAVKIIVEEAGGTVTSMHGEEQRYDGPVQGQLASNGLVHQALVDTVASVLEGK